MQNTWMKLGCLHSNKEKCNVIWTYFIGHIFILHVLITEKNSFTGEVSNTSIMRLNWEMFNYKINPITYVIYKPQMYRGKGEKISQHTLM